MKRNYQLLKLRIETVRNLKRLLVQTGQASLDDLIKTMIRLTDTHRQGLKDVGWDFQPKRDHR